MDNAAWRLLRILEAGQMLQKNITCASAWKTLLKAETAREVPEKYGQFLSLAGMAAEEVIRISPQSENAVNYWRGQILTAMSNSHLGSPWEHFLAHIDTHTLQYLRMQAELVDGKRPTKPLDDEKLQAARACLEASLIEIRDSNLPPEARIALISKIQAMILVIPKQTGPNLRGFGHETMPLL